MRKLFKKSSLQPHYFDLQNSKRLPIVIRMEKDKTKKGQLKNYTPLEVPRLTKQDLNNLASSGLLNSE